mgnify:CR=1 FL=1|jgi:hypothetical protein|tara:strand:+ start:1793 stop:2395 length:603 start_codon:yes stop_codon:yes gene_type:complete
MAKKCLPGVFCIENVTLVSILVILIIGLSAWYMINQNELKKQLTSNDINISSKASAPILLPISSRQDEFNDPYKPPLKNNMYHPRDSGDVRGIPVNIETRGMPSNYGQVGILTRTNGNEMILPLMGRRTMSGRDKWEYYTISGSGNLNARLPISVNGKNCSGEYGCDEVYDGDVVYVEGYNDTFRATIYENNSLRYIPVL